MARLKNSEWAVMIVQRALELDPKLRSTFLIILDDLGLLKSSNDNGCIKAGVYNVLKNCEKPNADLRILGKAKVGLAKINDRENVWEKHCWNFISQHQPGETPAIFGKRMEPLIKYVKRKMKRLKKQKVLH